MTIVIIILESIATAIAAIIAIAKSRQKAKWISTVRHYQDRTKTLSNEIGRKSKTIEEISNLSQARATTINNQLEIIDQLRRENETTNNAENSQQT